MSWLCRRLPRSLPLAALLAAGACSTAAQEDLLGDGFEFDSGSVSSSGGDDVEDDGVDPGSSGGATTGSGTTGEADPLDELPPRPGPLPPPGELYAGTWSDLRAWEEWTDVLSTPGPWDDHDRRWGLPTVGRRWSLEVNTPAGPARDVAVTLSAAEANWSARTDADGRVEMFVSFDELNGPASVVVDGAPIEIVPVAGQSARVEIAEATAPAPHLDLMFVVDTTGSMGDELDYLRAHLGEVLDEVVDGSEDGLLIRLSLNFYRDVGEEYVLLSHPFTTDIDQALVALDDVRTGGGGDVPEAVDLALQDAVFDHHWSPSARARILFLILDAPPRDDPSSLQRLRDGATEAARLGIRIVPITGSGTEESTAFLVRQLAILTAGTYAFITDPWTYAGLLELDTIGPYQPRPLSELLLAEILDRLG